MTRQQRWKLNNPERHRQIKKEQCERARRRKGMIALDDAVERHLKRKQKKGRLALCPIVETFRHEHRLNEAEKYRKKYWANPNKERDRVKSYKAANRWKCNLWNRTRKASMQSVACNLTPAEWLLIKEMYCGLCAYCGLPTELLTLDHIVPISKGGDHSFDNIAPACRSCNARKHDIDLLVFITRLATLGPPQRRKSEGRLRSSQSA